MGYRDLREFVAKLEKEGELKRIRAEVDPVSGDYRSGPAGGALGNAGRE